MVTLDPGIKRDWPSTTTLSPSFNPLAITARESTVRDTCTGRCFALPVLSIV
jgi:hypothetical protein